MIKIKKQKQQDLDQAAQVEHTCLFPGGPSGTCSGPGLGGFAGGTAAVGSGGRLCLHLPIVSVLDWLLEIFQQHSCFGEESSLTETRTEGQFLGRETCLF